MNTLTLQDVADLANVQRPVVSMWRKRPVVRGVSMPFPAPVDNAGGIERFDRDQIVEWLTDTGRGNNREHAYDASAVAVPAGVRLEEAVTLLCWHVLTGQELAGTSQQTRVTLADEYDPDDLAIAREIRQVNPPEEVLLYIDNLIEVSLGSSDALTRVETGRLSREGGLRGLSVRGIELLRCLIEAAAVHLGQDEVILTAQDAAVALDVAEACEIDICTTDRGLRRRALIRGLFVGEAVAGKSVSALSLVGRGISQTLDAIDDVVLGLASGDIAVVLGSASALTDELAGDLQHRRAEVLRVNNLVAALRLPRGLWTEAHRQALAVWVCIGGADAAKVSVADLGAVETIELTDLAADIAAALSRNDKRAYRYARVIDIAAIRARGPVVPPGVRAVKVGGDRLGKYLDDIHRATLTTTAPLDSLDVLARPADGNIRLQHRSLGEAHVLKRLRLLRGRRIDRAAGAVDGTVQVLPVELVGSLFLDPFDAVRKYPRAVRTEPGDVIFVEKPKPRAWVDARGGAMVASPARVIRLAESAEIGPRLLAAVINERASAGSEWKTWSVPVLKADEAARLEDALRRTEDYERELARRTKAAGDLKSALIDGVAAGALTLDITTTSI